MGIRDYKDLYEELVQKGIEILFDIPEIKKCVSNDHISKTPERFTKALLELCEGCFHTPEEVLTTTFGGHYDEIVYVNSISFVSLCQHHLLPFFGKVHFGYLPHAKIVGLSKIPRLVETLSRRPQVQEDLTIQIVDSFMKIVQPKGCGAVIESFHLCMNIRGVENESAYSKTSALRGIFKDNESTKNEFLEGIKKVTPTIWP